MGYCRLDVSHNGDVEGEESRRWSFGFYSVRGKCMDGVDDEGSIVTVPTLVDGLFYLE